MNRSEIMKKPPTLPASITFDQLDDEAGLAACASIDADAFARLYDLYFARVYKYVLYRVFEPQTADDLISIIFEKMLRGVGKFDPKKAKFSAWLFGIARHVVHDHYRNSRRVQWLPIECIDHLSDDTPAVEEELVQHEMSDLLLEGLRKLTDRERDLIGLKFAGEFNNRQIARMTGLSENNVGVILYRVLHRLREFMKTTEG